MGLNPRGGGLRLPSEAGAAADRLTGCEPHPTDFGNHSSALLHADFVDAEHLRCAARGVVELWDPARHGGAQPTAVSSLRLVSKADGSLRMCVNLMYINLYIKYRAFTYDRLVDLSSMIDEGDYMFTLDDKSGYWQLCMHPSAQRFAAVRWRGETLAIPVLAFGFANACYDYSVLKRAVYSGPCAWGLLLSSYIDDLWARERGLALARWRLLGFVLLAASLGFVLSTGKCTLRPAQRVRYLGFEADSVAQAFRVPTDKLAAFEQQLAEQEALCAAGGRVTARALARLVGKAISMAPAVPRTDCHPWQYAPRQIYIFLYTYFYIHISISISGARRVLCSALWPRRRPGAARAPRLGRGAGLLGGWAGAAARLPYAAAGAQRPLQLAAARRPPPRGDWRRLRQSLLVLPAPPGAGARPRQRVHYALHGGATAAHGGRRVLQR